MARYFFDIQYRKALIVDAEGTELPNDEAAMAEGKRVAAELLINALKSANEAETRFIEVRRGGKLIWLIDAGRVHHGLNSKSDARCWDGCGEINARTRSAVSVSRA